MIDDLLIATCFLCIATSLVGCLIVPYMIYSYLGPAHAVLIVCILAAVAGSEVIRSLQMILETFCLMVRFGCRLVWLLLTYVWSMAAYTHSAWTRNRARLHDAARKALIAVGVAAMCVHCICAAFTMELAIQIVLLALRIPGAALHLAWKIAYMIAGTARLFYRAVRDTVCLVHKLIGYTVCSVHKLIGDTVCLFHKLIGDVVCLFRKATKKPLQPQAKEASTQTDTQANSTEASTQTDTDETQAKIERLEIVIATIGKEFTCPVSLRIMDAPVILNPCGHAFDRPSFNSLRAARNPERLFVCPMCRREIWTHFESECFFLKNTITELKKISDA